MTTLPPEADSSDESIDLPDMPAAAFEAVLEHMYTGQPEMRVTACDISLWLFSDHFGPNKALSVGSKVSIDEDERS